MAIGGSYRTETAYPQRRVGRLPARETVGTVEAAGPCQLDNCRAISRKRCLTPDIMMMKILLDR